MKGIATRGFPDATVTERCRTLSAGTLEDQLLADGLEAELRTIANTWTNTTGMSMPQLKKCLEEHKVAVAAALAERIVTDAAFAARMPEVFRNGLTALKGLQ